MNWWRHSNQLEEAVYADMLIHVVDASSEESEEQVKVVNSILESLGAASKPVIMALNKMDMVKDSLRLAIPNPRGRIFEISAATGQGIDEMLEGIREMLPEDEKEVRLFIPYSDGWVISYIYQNGKVLEQIHGESGTEVKALIKKRKMEPVKGYIIISSQLE
ncbi:GTP-binding protein HflX [Acetivibrio straminisolvens JCM 21531]|uniref:GTP-binding protein HflX n=1 Tax=Acetivibrio straminisolvens JCM 21531 TaxID=1294263 RepID=W4VDT6_9FIRM|nr:GTP-binding protein HflX [Acetivibrio straminisolvens JCM 21531]